MDALIIENEINNFVDDADNSNDGNQESNRFVLYVSIDSEMNQYIQIC